MTSEGDLIAEAERGLTADSRLRELLSAYRAVTEGLDLDRVLRRIVEAAVALVHADYGALGVLGADGRLERFIHTGMDPVTAAAIGSLPEGHGLLGAVIEEAQTIRIPHVGRDPRASGFPAHHPPMDAFLGVPVRTRGQVFGNLYLTNPARGTFTAEDAELIESLAATAGVAIDNARLFETARRQERLASTSSRVNAALLAPAGEDVLNIVAEHVGAVVDADLITIVVPGDDDDSMRVAAAHGAEAERMRGISIAIQNTLSARAMRTGGIVADVTQRSYLGGELLLGPTAAVALTAAGQAIGALCVARNPVGEAFTPVELETVAEFAAQASIAITLAWARRDRQRLEVAEDRARIARDLHDHVIQRLFGAGLSLQAIAAADPSRGPQIEEQVAELDAAIAEIRTAIFTLRTRPHDRPGGVRHRVLDVVTELTAALAAPPRLTFKGPIDLAVHDDLADDVTAVVREALANVARHADAESTTVSITVDDHDVTVIVEDDGRGISALTAHEGGTANLRDRAGQRGGLFELARAGGRGTRLCWRAPLDPPAASSS